MTKQPFVHRRRVTFYETDQMGVMHHSNHVRVFEEARVEWLRDRGLLTAKGEDRGDVIFAVVSVDVKYLRPLKFDELMETYVEARAEGARLHFRYAIWSPSQKAFAATGLTTLVPLDGDLRPVRLEAKPREQLRKETWASTWPPANDI